MPVEKTMNFCVKSPCRMGGFALYCNSSKREQEVVAHGEDREEVNCK